MDVLQNQNIQKLHFKKEIRIKLFCKLLKCGVVEQKKIRGGVLCSS